MNLKQTKAVGNPVKGNGHSQVNMVTDAYSHIIEEDRRRNTEF